MIIRLEDSFIKLTQQLGKPFSDKDKHQLAELVSDSIIYDKLRSIMSDQERVKEQSKPTVIDLGNIDENYFALNVYYNKDQMEDDIPMSIRELLPTISPVHIDVMTNISSNFENNYGQNYIKAAQVYDDGDIHSHYVKEVVDEDRGISPIDEK